MSANTTIQQSPYQARLSTMKREIPANPVVRRRYIEWHRQIDSLHDLIVLALSRDVIQTEQVGDLLNKLRELRQCAVACENLERAEWEKSQS